MWTISRFPFLFSKAHPLILLIFRLRLEIRFILNLIFRFQLKNVRQRLMRVLLALSKKILQLLMSFRQVLDSLHTSLSFPSIVQVLHRYTGTSLPSQLLVSPNHEVLNFLVLSFNQALDFLHIFKSIRFRITFTPASPSHYKIRNSLHNFSSFPFIWYWTFFNRI